MRRVLFIAGTIAFLWTAEAGAQPDAPPASPPAGPSRPVVLPMTPGSELNSQTTPAPAKPKRPRPRIVLAPGASATPAQATSNSSRSEQVSPNDYTFCNRTSYAVSIAVGIRNGGLMATRGWWILPAGECKVVIKGPLTQPAYFSYARTSFAHTGAIRTWGGSHILCTGKGNFQATSDGSSQCGPGYEPQGFAKVDTQSRAGWTTTLSENPGYKNLETARTAGLQRLLMDIGIFDGAIDGVSGPKLTDAITQARTALAIGAADSTSLYGKLLTEAAKIQAASGLTFCNRTQEILWTAMGLDSPAKTQSMGWWRLQPGQCEKVIKDRLIDQFVYAYAIADQGGPKAESWGGNKYFCTKESVFEFEDSKDCSGKGFATTGFLQIDTGGRPGITFEFAPRNTPPTEQN